MNKAQLLTSQNQGLELTFYKVLYGTISANKEPVYCFQNWNITTNV